MSLPTGQMTTAQRLAAQNYQHQEYPKWVDGPAGRVLVANRVEEDATLGIKDEPKPAEPVEIGVAALDGGAVTPLRKNKLT